ncbi:MAG: tetratricopeptide repeat protein [Woeseiaceae bacterium]|nr:tetratricopeptide repeat protein [Woeseiaceae bacterium]
MTGLYHELKRRNVFRVAIAYVVLAWIILQVGEVLAPALHLPEWVNSLLAFFLILGFPLAIFFAWAFELTPEGLKKEKDVDRSESITHVTGRKLDFIIIALLVAALGWFAWQHWVVEPGHESEVVTTESRSPTIAVMPFLNMSSDTEQEYFSDGLSEELLNLLAKIPELQVTSRSSSFAFKGKDVTVPEFAAALNVAHVLEGSVRKSGNMIRVTAQLIDAENDKHLWSETWDRSLDDIFAIQDEIASAVVDELRIKLLGDVPHVPEVSADAYAMVLQARHLARERTREAYSDAEKLLKRALDIDPRYAQAWADLGRLYALQANLDIGTVLGLAEQTREASEKALALDPNNVTAYLNLADTEASVTYDFEQAMRHVDRALEISPGNAEAISLKAGVQFIIGNFRDGIKNAREATVLDPLDTYAWMNLAYNAFYAGQYDTAIEAFETVILLNPEISGAHWYIAMVLLTQGHFEAALERVRMENLDGFQYTGLATTQYSLGNDEASDEALAMLNELSVDWAYQRVQAYAWRGEIDKAFEWMETAYEIRDQGLNLILGDPLLDSIRDDPRFDAMLERLNRDPVR